MFDLWAAAAVALISVMSCALVAVRRRFPVPALAKNIAVVVAGMAVSVTVAWLWRRPIHEGAILVRVDPGHGVAVSDLVALMPLVAALYAVWATVRA